MFVVKKYELWNTKKIVVQRLIIIIIIIIIMNALEFMIHNT